MRFSLVHQQAGQGTPGHWRGLLHQGKATLAAVQDQLLHAGTFERTGRAMVAVDRQAIAGLQARVRQILSGAAEDEHLRLLDAALVAVASVIPVKTVFDPRRKQQDRERADALARLVTTRAPGFERLLTQMRRTRGRSYWAGGPVH